MPPESVPVVFGPTHEPLSTRFIVGAGNFNRPSGSADASSLTPGNTSKTATSLTEKTVKAPNGHKFRFHRVSGVESKSTVGAADHPVNGALALWRRSMHLKTSIAILKWERMIQYQLLQPGGMAVDTPHVPHNTPEGEVGKPEGLSGSQIAAMFLLQEPIPGVRSVHHARVLKIAFTLSRYRCFLPRLKVCVNIVILSPYAFFVLNGITFAPAFNPSR